MQRNLGTGVYIILNTINAKCYIGSAATAFRGRWYNHLSQLRRGVHDNKYLQRAWYKYGEFNFEFRVLEYCKPEDCVRREQWWMNLYEAYDKDFGYNLSPTAGNCLGMKRTEESKKRMSIAHIGKKHTPAHAAAISAGNKGKIRTPEMRAHYSVAMRGKPKSPEHRANLSKAKLGKKPRWTTKQREDARQRRIAYNKSDKMRAAVSTAHKGKAVSQETRAKLRAANLGKTRNVMDVADVLCVVSLYRLHRYSEDQLARFFDTTTKVIRNIVTGRRWSKITGIGV